MTTPLFLVSDEPATLPPKGQFRLSGLRGARATRTRQLHPEDKIILGDGQGNTAPAMITSVGRDFLELVVETSTHTPQPTQRVAVVHHVDSPSRDALAVAELTELGACEISALAPPEMRNALAKSAPHWRKVARETAERSGQVWLPRTGFVYTYAGLQRRFDWGGEGLVLDPAADTLLSTVDITGELVLVVGDPEKSVSGWVQHVRLDAHPPTSRAAAVAAMMTLAIRLP